MWCSGFSSSVCGLYFMSVIDLERTAFLNYILARFEGMSISGFGYSFFPWLR